MSKMPFARQARKINLNAETIYECLGITEQDYKFERDYIKNPVRKIIVRPGGGLEYEKPNDNDLRYMYNELNVSVQNMNKIIGHKISDYLAKFGKKKELNTPKISKEVLEDMLFNKKMCLMDIARSLGYKNSVVVSTLLKKYGIEYNSYRYVKNRGIDDKDFLYQKYIIENKSIAEIAEEYGSIKTTISQLLTKHGIAKSKKMITQNAVAKRRSDLENHIFKDKDNFLKFLQEYNISNAYEFVKVLGGSEQRYYRYARLFNLTELLNTKRSSCAELRWLDEMGVPNDKLHRQVRVGKYWVDGYIPETNTVYEFLGDMWHGNPRIFRQDAKPPRFYYDATFGDLYKKTIEKIDGLKAEGFNVVYIWECDYDPKVSYNRTGKNERMLPPEVIAKNVKLKKRVKYRNIAEKYAAMGMEVPHGTKIGHKGNVRYFYPEDEILYGPIKKAGN